MNQLRLSARLYIASVIGAAAVVVVLCLRWATFSDPLLFGTLLILACATGSLTIVLPFGADAAPISVAYALDFVSLLLVGPHETMVIASVGALSQYLVHGNDRPAPYRLAFNIAALILTVQAAGAVFNFLEVPMADPLTLVSRPLVGAAITYFAVHTALVSMQLAFGTRLPTLTTWRSNFLWAGPNYLASAGMAALAFWAVNRLGFWAAPLILAPVYLTYHTYRSYTGRIDAQRRVQETSDLHLATIEALAGAIDAKDQMTNSHILRVQIYATGLAEAVGLSHGDIQAVKTAAMLHDIGKLAVPEHILSKPGPLTPEEFQKIRIHPKVGAEIIAGVPFPHPVAPLILSHHERWDGKGYPQGLAGDAIPIGARILTVVDYYDAVTSERPYHSALSHESAVNLLKHEAGRALDRNLVDVFIKLLPQLLERCAKATQVTPRAAIAAAAGVVAETAAEDTRAIAFENIGLAHREIYALYEIAQAMGTSLGVSDTMALVSSKLTKIIPWSGCALFLQQQDTGLMRCRYAAGVDAPRLLDTTIRLGEGLSGWVGRNRRTLVNASPRAEFEAAGVSTDLRLHSAIVCPLYVGETFIGSLALFHVEPNLYTDDHRRLIASVSEQAGAVIHNSIVFEQAQEDSLTDPLTSLPNRRSMFARLTHELARAERLQTELALIVLDIDEFKVINDTHGHHVGDQALREVATSLRAALRPYDLCVRFAGDEFIAVISDCSQETAELKRVELQERISAIEIHMRPGQRIRLRASAGAAVFPHDGTTYEGLLASADRRMYEDKSTRRSTEAEPSDGTNWIADPGGRLHQSAFVPEGLRYYDS